MIMPIGEDLFVDSTGGRIDDFGGIAVVADWREYRLPDVPLFGGPAMRAQHEFVRKCRTRKGNDRTVGPAIRGNRNLAKITSANECVGVVVEIDVLVGVEVDRIGTRHIGAVIKVRIKNLRGK